MKTFDAVSAGHIVIPAKAPNYMNWLVRQSSAHGEPVEPFIGFDEPFDKLRVSGALNFWIPAFAGMTRRLFEVLLARVLCECV
jgi:hypothetical protein